MTIANHIGKDLMNVPEFAKKKNVSTTAVWNAINSDRISVVLVGEKKGVFIKWSTHQEFEFDENKKNR